MRLYMSIVQSSEFASSDVYPLTLNFWPISITTKRDMSMCYCAHHPRERGLPTELVQCSVAAMEHGSTARDFKSRSVLKIGQYARFLRINSEIQFFERGWKSSKSVLSRESYERAKSVLCPAIVQRRLLHATENLIKTARGDFVGPWSLECPKNTTSAVCTSESGEDIATTEQETMSHLR